jgi:hypothetical protein
MAPDASFATIPKSTVKKAQTSHAADLGPMDDRSYNPAAPRSARDEGSTFE